MSGATVEAEFAGATAGADCCAGVTVAAGACAAGAAAVAVVDFEVPQPGAKVTINVAVTMPKALYLFAGLVFINVLPDGEVHCQMRSR